MKQKYQFISIILISILFFGCITNEHNINVHFLDAYKTKEYTRLKPKIRSIIYDTIEEFQEYLPINNLDIIVTNNPEYNTILPNYIGISGMAYDKTTTSLMIDLNFDQIEKSIDTELRRILLHELNHVFRNNEVPDTFYTLFAAIISEGIADYFEITITGQDPHIWSTAIPETQLRDYIELMKYSAWDKKYDQERWFYGTEDLPQHLGYSMGFMLVEQYLQKHPNTTIFDLSRKPANRIYSELDI